jgi:crotonobetainyl-CoA:carnitine CoA-transferase CaiB-like acyl-CoA transferase
MQVEEGHMPGRPMDGVRVVEVAQYTYVPAVGAVLADWGADVVKVEHAVTGDARVADRRVAPQHLLDLVGKDLEAASVDHVAHPALIHRKPSESR